MGVQTHRCREGHRFLVGFMCFVHRLDPHYLVTFRVLCFFAGFDFAGRLAVFFATVFFFFFFFGPTAERFLRTGFEGTSAFAVLGATLATSFPSAEPIASAVVCKIPGSPAGPFCFVSAKKPPGSNCTSMLERPLKLVSATIGTP
jgi:hypothetical protein